MRRAVAIAIGARVPVLLWGGPGVGKTSAVREMAERADLPCEVVIASIREPTDFAGLPVIDADGRSVHLAPPNWAKRLAEAGRGVVFLDEITTAAPAVQAALMRVVLERAVGDLALPAAVTIVAAANPPQEAADGWDLAAPLANRFCHIDWTVSAREFANGLLGSFDAIVPPIFDSDALAAAEAQARSLVASFVMARGTLVHRVPANAIDAGRGWPSPRSWTTAARLLAAAELADAPPTTTSLLVSGCVGPAAAAEWQAWRADLVLPDPEAVLADPSSFQLPERGDRTFAALASLTAAVRSNNTPERWGAAWRAIAVAASGGHPDVAVASVRALIDIRPKGAVPPREVLATMTPVLREAGILDRLMAR